MLLALCHTGADFDAIASLYAASLIYEGATLCAPGGWNENVKEFLNMHKERLSMIKTASQIKKEDVKSIILVDTRQRGRVKGFEELLKRTVFVYDHHIASEDDVKVGGKIEKVGATITIMLEEIKEEKIDEFAASLFLLGIYEDTGFLSFPTTTAKDIKAAAYLVEKGAQFSYIQKFLRKRWNRETFLLLSKLFEDRSCYNIGGRKIIFSFAKLGGYREDLSFIAQEFMNAEEADAVFLFLEREKKTSIVARSKDSLIDVASLLSPFGGGGHSSAASCTVKKIGSDTLYYLIRSLQKILLPKMEYKEDMRKEIEEKIPSSILNLLKDASAISSQKGWRMYIVGGVVRDMLLGNESKDIDVVVEGDVYELTKNFLKKGIECKVFERFGTAKITFENYTIDLATARKETYPHPGALPIVEKGTIIDDLFRRDFTINALAISLTTPFGALVDPFGGREDIEKKYIRVMHNFSFIEDPTRILRGVRFAKRLSFDFEEHTKRLLYDALKAEALKEAPKGRMKDEFLICLSEENAKDIMLELLKIGALHQIIKSTKIKESSILMFDEAKRVYEEFKEFSPSLWFVNLFLLFDELGVEEIRDFFSSFPFSAKITEHFIYTKENMKKTLEVLGKECRKSKIYKLLSHYCIEALLYLIVKTEEKEKIKEYIKERKNVKILDGVTIMKKFSLPQSPLIGKIKERLLQAYLDEGIKTVDEQIEYIAKLLKEEGL